LSDADQDDVVARLDVLCHHGGYELRHAAAVAAVERGVELLTDAPEAPDTPEGEFRAGHLPDHVTPLA
jgi:hypothetical protein